MLFDLVVNIDYKKPLIYIFRFLRNMKMVYYLPSAKTARTKRARIVWMLNCMVNDYNKDEKDSSWLNDKLSFYTLNLTLSSNIYWLLVARPLCWKAINLLDQSRYSVGWGGSRARDKWSWAWSIVSEILHQSHIPTPLPPIFILHLKVSTAQTMTLLTMFVLCR